MLAGEDPTYNVVADFFVFFFFKLHVSDAVLFSSKVRTKHAVSDVVAILDEETISNFV